MAQGIEYGNDQQNQNQGNDGNDSEIAARYKASPLTLTVFEREYDDGGKSHQCQLQRTYPKDDDGNEFGYTPSMRPRDLRKAARLLKKAADDFDQVRVEQPDE